MQSRKGLLLCGVHRAEAHCGVARRLANRFGIDEAVQVAFDEWFDALFTNVDTEKRHRVHERSSAENEKSPASLNLQGFSVRLTISLNQPKRIVVDVKTVGRTAYRFTFSALWKLHSCQDGAANEQRESIGHPNNGPLIDTQKK
jgi:hypothetical protein